MNLIQTLKDLAHFYRNRATDWNNTPISDITIVGTECNGFAQNIEDILNKFNEIETISKLNWTETKPTVEGLYLYRQRGFWPIHVDFVKRGNWQLRQNPEWLYFSDKCVNEMESGLWAGPLEEPPKQ